MLSERREGVVQRRRVQHGHRGILVDVGHSAVIRMPADDPLGALKIGPRCSQRARADGVLAGTTFVAKDLYDVAGYPTGAGNPQWEATHPLPTTTSSAVTRLLAAGATLIGKSHTDELAYSLSGTNVHYGTPVNDAAPGCVPGGSSSGSASAVAGGLCDFALGSDTGGSVRVPASFCGIVGLRPTHGRVAADGVVPLAPSFDAVGWFANSGAVLMQVGTRAPRHGLRRDCAPGGDEAGAR